MPAVCCRLSTSLLYSAVRLRTAGSRRTSDADGFAAIGQPECQEAAVMPSASHRRGASQCAATGRSGRDHSWSQRTAHAPGRRWSTQRLCGRRTWKPVSLRCLQRASIRARFGQCAHHRTPLAAVITQRQCGRRAGAPQAGGRGGGAARVQSQGRHHIHAGSGRCRIPVAKTEIPPHGIREVHC